MKLATLLICLPALALASACADTPPPAAAPAEPLEAVAADPGHYSVITENDAVRILRISYGPGEKSQLHRHPEAIVIPLASGTTRFTLPDGTTRDADLVADTAMYMPAETHNPENAGTTRSDAILVEFKTPAPGTAELPAEREGMAMTFLAEGPRALAYRVTLDRTFVEPAGSTHDYDQVVIALGPGDVSVTMDGKVAKSTWARGDVLFIGRGVAHETRNTGGKPADIVIVSIK
jgi:quercetin dioxygenase-like cupin family protein